MLERFPEAAAARAARGWGDVGPVPASGRTGSSGPTVRAWRATTSSPSARRRGVELLLNLAPELPADLPAAVFVVLHTAPEFVSSLPEFLSQRGPLRAYHPLHGDRVEPGRMYVAPPDNHLQLRPGFVDVVRGAKENAHRPAVDALFRTASRAYGSRVVGVVLSGLQDCGTAGMLSVKARGGITVVQDPATALAPDMPRSVLAKVEVDHVVQPAELPGLLDDRKAEIAPEPPAGPATEP